MNPKDHIGDPCDCMLCQQAGISDRPIVRDPYSGSWLHGYDLKRWYEAREGFIQKAKSVAGPLGRAALSIASRVPGEDG